MRAAISFPLCVSLVTHTRRMRLHLRLAVNLNYHSAHHFWSPRYGRTRYCELYCSMGSTTSWSPLNGGTHGACIFMDSNASQLKLELVNHSCFFTSLVPPDPQPNRLVEFFCSSISINFFATLSGLPSVG